MFMYRKKNKRVRIATSFANQLMQNHEGFFNKILEFGEFEETEVSNEDILSFVKDRYMNSIQEIVVSRRYNPWGSAIASFNPKRPNQIRLNAWKIRRSADSITGSILHEMLHLVDNYYKTAKFGHAYSYYPGREKTAPYSWGIIAKKHCMETID